MKFGCHLPVYGPAATRATILGFARRMESLGFDSLWASDHVVIPWKIRSRYPYNPTGDFPLSPETPFLEPLTTLAVVAGATEHIALGTTVLVLAHRHPVLLAKMLATLDQLSGGRVIVGAGVGWMKEEIELFGVNYQRRGAWSDEALRVLRACWREPRPRFEGTFFRFATRRPRSAASPSSGTAGTRLSPRRSRSARRCPVSATRAAEPGATWRASPSAVEWGSPRDAPPTNCSRS